MAYKETLRRKVVNAYLTGKLETQEKAAEVFEVSLSSVKRWCQAARIEGRYQALPTGGLQQERRIDAQGEAFLQETLRSQPGLSAHDLALAYQQHFGILPGTATVNRTLHRLGLSSKRTRKRPPQRERAEVEEARKKFVKEQSHLETARVVVVDESGVDTAMAPRSGWSPVGQPAVVSAPVHGQRFTLLAGLGLQGLRVGKVMQGYLTGARFLQWVQEDLLPTLKKGDLVLLDNSSIHKAPLLRPALRRVGVKLKFLPPYSPDFSPIENWISKLKLSLRKQAVRTQEALRHAVEIASQTISEKDIRAWFSHCGWRVH